MRYILLLRNHAQVCFHNVAKKPPTLLTRCAMIVPNSLWHSSLTFYSIDRPCIRGVLNFELGTGVRPKVSTTTL